MGQKGRGANASRRTPQQRAAATRRKNAAEKKAAAEAAQNGQTVNGVLVQRVEGAEGSFDVHVSPMGDIKLAEIPTLLRRGASQIERKILEA